MYFHIYCTDVADSAALRESVRDEHRAYIRSFADRLFTAGPTLAADGETQDGSVFILEADSAEEAAAFNAGDPFAKAGVFAKVEIRPYHKALPRD